MDQSQAQFEKLHAELECRMELTDALIAKIQSRDEQHNVFMKYVRIGSQFEIWIEDDETEEKDEGQVDNLEDDIPLQFTFRRQNQEEFVPPETFIGCPFETTFRYLVYPVLSYPNN